MKRHDLKTWPAFFEHIWRGAKRFELRKNDRDFHTGDELLLREWEPDPEKYTGRYVRVHVTYVLRGPILGLAEGWVVMSIAQFERGTQAIGKC